MPRRLPVRALALALALAVAAAAGVDAGGEKLPDCRWFYHFAGYGSNGSNNPGSFPACSLLKSGKLLRVNFAPVEQPTTGQSYSKIRMFDLGQIDRADIPNGLVDFMRRSSYYIPVDLERYIDEAYGYKSFSKRWKRMRKQGSKDGLPALIYDFTGSFGNSGAFTGDFTGTFDTKVDKVKFGKKNGVVFADYQVSKGSRAALASAWGSNEAAPRSLCKTGYATPCPRLGLP